MLTNIVRSYVMSLRFCWFFSICISDTRVFCLCTFFLKMGMRIEIVVLGAVRILLWYNQFLIPSILVLMNSLK